MYDTWNLICNLISSIGTFCSFLAMLIIARNTNKSSQQQFKEENQWKKEQVDLKRKETEVTIKFLQTWEKLMNKLENSHFND